MAMDDTFCYSTSRLFVLQKFSSRFSAMRLCVAMEIVGGRRIAALQLRRRRMGRTPRHRPQHPLAPQRICRLRQDDTERRVEQRALAEGGFLETARLGFGDPMQLGALTHGLA